MSSKPRRSRASASAPSSTSPASASQLAPDDTAVAAPPSATATAAPADCHFPPATTCTPGYVLPSGRLVDRLTEDQQLDVVTQLMGYPARKLLFDIHEAANAEIFSILQTLETWLSSRLDPPPAASLPKGVRPPTTEALELEMDTGLHALETLLTSQMDAAMELFMSWSYRNAFTVGEWGGVVLPAHEGLDFLRGKYVSELPDGERTIDASLEALRTKVEQKRRLKATLTRATALSQLAVVRTQALLDEIAFIRSLAAKHALEPLPETLEGIAGKLKDLYGLLSDRSAITSPPTASMPGGGGAFEVSRAAHIRGIEERASAAADAKRAGGSGGAGGGDGSGGGVAGGKAKGGGSLDDVDAGLDKVGRGIEEGQP